MINSWWPLNIMWEGGKDVINKGLPRDKVTPAWQVLLLGDGSPTRHLQLLTGESIEVDIIDMSLIGRDSDNAPDLIHIVPGPRLRRQVWLRTTTGQRLAYATSWWEERHVNEYLENKSLPIWASLTQSRMELYRDIQGVHYGESAELASAFERPGPFWGRKYLFWHQGKPITLIYEVFSPYLEKYLGQTKFEL